MRSLYVVHTVSRLVCQQEGRLEVRCNRDACSVVTRNCPGFVVRKEIGSTNSFRYVVLNLRVVFLQIKFTCYLFIKLVLQKEMRLEASLSIWSPG